jgi:hypothetical protein
MGGEVKSPLVITDSKAEPFNVLLSNGENLLCASLSKATVVPGIAIR